MLNYGVILASGSGTRMKNIDIPKQYYEIDNKPIIMYTLDSMLSSNMFDKIYIAIQKEYEELLNNLLNKYVSLDNINKIRIVYGGKERIDTIHNVIDSISLNNISDDDVVVIHDAVRPFVTKRILEDSISGARKFGAVVAGIPAEDTMLISGDGVKVDEIPNRKLLYKGQAPDSFRIKTLIELESKLTANIKKRITGTSQICTFNNYPIRIVMGDAINFKITTDGDLDMARGIVLSRKKK